ncbi:hypothetical protein BT93_F3306 [Corymbia citriodora subsp. variegata]|nr:hypothetical protein BT93_F3306 [Corymbia citriodora subsp. variegata]
MEPSEALRIMINDNGGENVSADEPSPSEPERVICIKEELKQGCQDHVPGSWAQLSIYRFPHYLKDGNDKAWVPQIISLGPYHHSKEHLHHMEQHKLRCLHHILRRANHERDLYLDSVKEVEERARACYEGTISMSSDKFVEMMVLDGCFVIKLFRGFNEGFEKLGYHPNDPIFSIWESILKIQQDMIMLENQIPLFVLDLLLGLQLGNPNQKERVAKLVIYFFDSLHPNSSTFDIYKFNRLSDHCSVHCLEVFWWSLLHLNPTRSKTMHRPRSWKLLIPSLTELRHAGIQIRLKYTDDWGDIEFKDRVLSIPQLVIRDGTGSLFLNLIAFEQSHFNCSNYVTSCVVFMHNLIKSSEDVQYLRNKRIILHCLESDAKVSDLFSRLCQELAFDNQDSHLYDLSGEVKLQCHQYLRIYSRWNQWRAILKNKYFDNPWSIISLVAAFVLLVLTFIQSMATTRWVLDFLYSGNYLTSTLGVIKVR